MLEAFFTRQRQRSIAIILSALTCMVWIGHFQSTVSSGNQASQTDDPKVVAASDTSSVHQAYKRAELVEDSAVSSQTDAAKPSTTVSQSTANVAANFAVTNQHIERTELSNGIVYDLYYKLVPTGNFGAPTIKAVLTGNRNCTEVNTQTFRYTDPSAADQVVRCSLTAADVSMDSTNTAQFKLEITADGVATSQSLSFTWTPAKL